MLEYYIFGSVFVPVAQLFTFVSYSLYLGYGLGNIPYGLLSCRSHSFIIFLHITLYIIYYLVCMSQGMKRPSGGFEFANNLLAPLV